METIGIREFIEMLESFAQDHSESMQVIVRDERGRERPVSFLTYEPTTKSGDPRVVVETR